RQAAFNVDALNSSRPIEFPVAAPHDAEAMFDVLTYEKGASVLRMLEQYVSPEVFRAGVRSYLKKHAFGSTQTADLWESLGGAGASPPPAMMEGWVFRAGYPLISARREGNELVLRQQRFRYLQTTDDPQPWQVPVQVRVEVPTTGATVERVLMTGLDARLKLPA